MADRKVRIAEVVGDFRGAEKQFESCKKPTVIVICAILIVRKKHSSKQKQKVDLFWV